jgi:two-component system, OmpR family, response regulator PhoP
MRILVVEDEDSVRESLKQQLAEAEFAVDAAGDGEEGLFAGLNFPLDAAIVDLGLPKRDGLEIIRAWRAKARTFPVLVLTARNGWRDRVDGLQAGANDYVGKPFSFEEVLLRVKGLLCMSNGWSRPELVCGPYVLDTRLRALRIDGAGVDLTNYEYRVLEHFMLHAGETLSGTQIAEHMYEEEIELESNFIAQLVCRLRRKLDPEDRIKPIETVYGGGYRFAVDRGAAGKPISNRRPRWR